MYYLTVIRFRLILSCFVLSTVLFLCSCSSSNSNETTNLTDSIQIRSTKLGDVFADESGMTLYTFNNDSQGKSNCNDDCATNWPPLSAKDNASPEGRFTIITRDDGTPQWALHAWPLYRWINDSAPGDTNGEEVNGLWYVAQPIPFSKWSADVTTARVVIRVTVLTNENKKTLYVFPVDRDKPGGSACNNECATAWPPVVSESTALSVGDFNLVTRDDGSMQWAYKNMPLYLWASDVIPGDTSGEEVNNTWYVAQPVPVSKFFTDSQGAVVTDSNWRSLYTLENELTNNLICTNACLLNWLPLLASDNDINRGDFTIYTGPDGLKRWAYKGKPLYRWHEDVISGDTNGHGLTHPSGNVWTVAAL